MSTTFIYALCEPDTGEVRYIGKANNLVRRFKGHLEHRNRTNSHKNCWIRSLLLAGQKPVMELLDEVSEEVWPQWEVAWIQFFLEEGFDLVNSNAGGEGGIDPSLLTRAKLCAASLGKRQSSETCAKISISLLGNKRCLGKKHSLETKTKRAASCTGGKRTPEQRVRMSVALKGIKKGPMSKEHKEAISAAVKLRWAKKKGLI